MGKESTWKPEAFVENVIQKINRKEERAYAAVMRRADNPNLCSAAWEHLIPFCDIGDERQRLSFAAIGAAIARGKPGKDGCLNFCRALRSLCSNNEDVERESSRLRRLIACDSTEELLPVLRPILQYVQGKTSNICYMRLLQDLLYWREEIRIRWTQEFYYRTGDGTKEEEKVSCTI